VQHVLRKEGVKVASRWIAIMGLSVPQKDVDLKIPADMPDLMEPEYRNIRDFKGFLASAAPAITNALEKKGRDCIFSLR
jgi:hypothetical protein